MLVWAVVYLAVAAGAAVLVASRRDPTIVRGDWIFLLTSLFVLLAAIVTAVRGGQFSLGVLAVTVLVLVAGWMVRSRWWVVGAQSAVVCVTVDECASRLCAPTAREGGESTVAVPGGAIRLRIAPAGRSTVIVFIASPRHRKVALFRRLLAKQYRPVMPTIRLRPPAAGAG